MKKAAPYHLINYLKLISAISIVLLHTSEFVFYQDVNPVASDTFFYFWIEHFSRYIPFSGQTIVFLIFFLWGLKKKRISSPYKFFGILIGIHLLIGTAFWEDETFYDALEWDIYPFIICTYLITLFLDKWPSNRRIYLLTSLIFLALPSKFYAELPIPTLLSGALIGNCSKSLSGSWPLLPWSFLGVLGYFFADEIKLKNKISKFELLVWAPLLMTGFTQFGKMYDVLMGPGFYCYILNTGPMIFWGNFIFVIFLVRLSLVEQVQEKLNNLKLSQFISNLAWSRSFGACYITQIILLVGASRIKWFFQKPIVFDLLLISLMPLTEFIVRLLPILKSKLFSK